MALDKLRMEGHLKRPSIVRFHNLNERKGMQDYFLSDILFSDEVGLLQTMLKRKGKQLRRAFIKGRIRFVCTVEEITGYLTIAKEDKPLCRSYEFSDTRKVRLLEKLEQFIKDHS